MRAVGRVAVAKCTNRNLRVGVLFDVGSQQSFVTTKAVQSAGLQAKAKESIEICMFGQETRESGLKRVYDLQVFPFQEGNGSQMEAYEVPIIAQIRNKHIEIKKNEYPLLQGLWFSYVSRDKEILGVDLLIRADYFWPRFLESQLNYSPIKVGVNLKFAQKLIFLFSLEFDALGI